MTRREYTKDIEALKKRLHARRPFKKKFSPLADALKVQYFPYAEVMAMLEEGDRCVTANFSGGSGLFEVNLSITEPGRYTSYRDYEVFTGDDEPESAVYLAKMAFAQGLSEAPDPRRGLIPIAANFPLRKIQPVVDVMKAEAKLHHMKTNPYVFGQARTNHMTAITAKFPGQHCVECGAEFIPGESQITVHPHIRGPRGGKKYAHANPGECGMRSNPFGRRNPLRDLSGGRKRKSKYTESYVAGSHAAKKLLAKHDAQVVMELGTAAAWGAANRGGLVPYWADEDPEFYAGFIDTLPAVRSEARSLVSGYESSDRSSRYNPRVFRNAGRRTFKGQPKAGRLERMGPVTGLPSVGTMAEYHDTDARSLSSKQLVDIGGSWAVAELRRRGRDADGVKLAWKK